MNTFKKTERLAVLTWEFRVRVLDISATGALVASDRRMAVGTLGRVLLMFGAEEYVDDVEVVRCQIAEDSSGTYHIGMRFLASASRHERSIRAAAESVDRIRPTTSHGRAYRTTASGRSRSRSKPLL